VTGGRSAEMVSNVAKCAIELEVLLDVVVLEIETLTRRVF
jgi:hypothetical protein